MESVLFPYCWNKKEGQFREILLYPTEIYDQSKDSSPRKIMWINWGVYREFTSVGLLCLKKKWLPGRFIFMITFMNKGYAVTDL